MHRTHRILGLCGVTVFSTLLALNAASAWAETRSTQDWVWDRTTNTANFVLTTVKKSPVYDQIWVKETCTKEEVIGYDRVCEPVTREECENVTRRVCRDEPRQECHSTTRRECSSHPVCENQSDEICREGPNGRVCTPITRRVCHDETLCRDVPDEVCQTRYETVCRDETDRVCHEVSDTECRDVARTRTVEYDCSHYEQVVVGEEVDYSVDATVRVNVDVSALPTVSATPNETFTLSLDDTEVGVSLKDSSKKFLLFKNITQSVKDVAKKKKAVNAVVSIKAVELASIESVFQEGIQGAKFEGGVLSFQMKKFMFSDQMRFYVTLVRKRLLWSDKGVFDGIVDPKAIEVLDLGDHQQFKFHLKQLALAEGLKNKNYKVVIEAALKKPKLGEALNGNLMKDVLRTRFEGKLKNK